MMAWNVHEEVGKSGVKSGVEFCDANRALRRRNFGESLSRAQRAHASHRGGLMANLLNIALSNFS